MPSGSGSCCFLLLNGNPILNRWINSYKNRWGVPQWWMCCNLESIDLMPCCGGGFLYSTGWGAEMHCILESTNFNSDNSLILYVLYTIWIIKDKRKVVSKIESSQSFSIFDTHTQQIQETFWCWMSSQLFCLTIKIHILTTCYCDWLIDWLIDPLTLVFYL